VVGERITAPRVDPHHCSTLVAGVVHDAVGLRASFSGSSDKARTQAVASEVGRFEPCGLRVVLHHIGHAGGP
jgi:hypothetical protein